MISLVARRALRHHHRQRQLRQRDHFPPPLSLLFLPSFHPTAMVRRAPEEEEGEEEGRGNLQSCRVPDRPTGAAAAHGNSFVARNHGGKMGQLYGTDRMS